MTEKQKMLAGAMYDPMDPELVVARDRARSLFQKINMMSEAKKKERDTLFYELVGSAGSDLWIEPPFYCDYGENIHLGNQVFMNFGCCILDVCEVRIGNNAMLAPNVQIYTATHPLEAKARNSGKEFAKPITIGDNVWIGGNAVICPGVTIGNNVVIGAGAVVTKSFPDDVFIAGNPAKVIRSIDNS
ncbi:MAG: sugar O-acetyltransferase [Bacteroidia bacterium]|nr:sugar O-acetyltransferase [Bacteroidia bacterium]MBT8269542.1 sugar O-acetyltransferase [Bacteroidia bacterium]NNK69775.1 sugar O-acetyltransferase [Flavobacteriaceae bacterium]NNL80162.1 sugar O-acetyltransferase [Flavobacteriaceae bacterium]